MPETLARPGAPAASASPATGPTPGARPAEPLYGKFRGKVLNNEDKLGLGRLQLLCPAVPGLKDGWALPCTPYAGKDVGFYAMPPKDANVWVEFEGGDPNYPVWTGCFWGDDEMPLRPATPVRKVFKTASCTLVADDTDDKGGFTLRVAGPAAKEEMFVTIGPDSIVLSCPQSKVTMKMDSIEITVPQAVATMNASTIKLTVPTSAVTITGQSVKVDTPPSSIVAGGQSIRLSVPTSSLSLSPASVQVQVPASSLNLTAAAVQLRSAAVQVQGVLSQTGPASITGTLNVTGATTLVGPLTATSPVIALTGAALSLTAPAVSIVGMTNVMGLLTMAGHPVLVL
jgi:hypothetical protein